MPEGAPASCITCNDKDDLVRVLKDKVSARGQVFVFFGERWHTNRGETKFLLPPPGQGDKIPLSAAEVDMEPDESGTCAAEDVEDALPGRPSTGR